MTDTPLVLPGDPSSRDHRQGSATFGASPFRTLDIDGDSRLSRSEFIGSSLQQPNANRTVQPGRGADVPSTNTEAEFAVLDADKDGYLSESELASAHARVRP